MPKSKADMRRKVYDTDKDGKIDSVATEIDHTDLLNITTDQHHAQDHASRHGAGGSDELGAELIESRTSDPTLETARIWLRSDQNILKYSPDGSNVLAVGWTY